MKPIKVLFINGEMICGGTENFLMNIYRNIDRSIVDIDFLTHYSEDKYYDKEIIGSGGKIFKLTVREDNNFIKYFIDLNKFFREHPEYKIIHGNFESFGTFYNMAAQNNGVKVRIAHSHIAHDLPGIKGKMKSILNFPLKYTATDRIACSEAAGKYLFGKKDFQVFYNPIDIEKFKYDEKKREQIRREIGASDCFVIGHVGRFNLQKNHKFLIDVFANICKYRDNVVLLLCGAGPMENDIKKLVKDNRLDSRVRFLGSRDDMDLIYQGMDLFVLPSLFEGLPISGTEAQAAGLKCLFSNTITTETDITGNCEFLPIIDAEDIWRRTILNIIDNPIKREDLSEKIKKAGFDIKTQAKTLQDFYVKRYNEEYVGK